jgi:hypothetical protein
MLFAQRAGEIHSRPKITYVELELDEKVPDKSEPERPPEPKRQRPPERELRRLADVEFEELPEPEEPPEPETPPERIDPVLDQMKMVEQPDELDEDQAPADASYLSNINREVREQTRAKLTNLERDSTKQSARRVEQTPEKELGTADESEIAEARDRKSRLDRKAPRERPSPEEKRPTQSDAKPLSLLSMRELERREHSPAKLAHDPRTSEAPDGSLEPREEEQASLQARDQRARIDRNDRRYRFRVTQDDLDAVFGRDLVARRKELSERRSKQRGIWDGPRERWQSPLENMIPEVQVGNQTALNSRRHPFARYIATMHRRIHDLWAWGYLEDLDMRGRSHPLNDYSLWTRVEMVVSGDGTIDKVITVRYSGSTEFDSAAREIVWASGPFPLPPREIMSGNGKVYIHWAFHRDERACGTFGARPFILDNAGRGDRPDPSIEVLPTRASEKVRRLRRRAASRLPAVPEGPAMPGASVPRHPGPHQGRAHQHGPGGHVHLPGVELPAGATPDGPSPPASRTSPESHVSDPAARKLANAWLHYLAEGELDELVARSGLPFYSGRTPVARTRDELRDMLRTLSEETRGVGRPKAAILYTAAELRKLFGSVPLGVEEGGGRVYALTKTGEDFVVLILDRSLGSWRVVGITR